MRSKAGFLQEIDQIDKPSASQKREKNRDRQREHTNDKYWECKGRHHFIS